MTVLGIDISKDNFDAALLETSSGKPHHRALPNTPAGSPRLRRTLYFPARAALRFNPAIAVLRALLLAAGKAKKLIVGVAMHKLHRRTARKKEPKKAAKRTLTA